MTTKPPFYTRVQAAAIVGCNESTIRRHLEPVCKIGQAWAYSKDDVEAMAATWVNGKTNKKPLGDSQKWWQITPSSKARARTKGGVGLYNAMQKIIEKRPELAEVVK
jgi:hypothetical protein